MKVSTFITFLARKHEQNSNTTKLSSVQQIFILLQLTNLCKYPGSKQFLPLKNFPFIYQHGLYLIPLVSDAISTADFHKRFRVSINKFYRVIDRRNTCRILITLLENFNNCTPLFKLLLFIEYEEKKQQEDSCRSLNFSRRSTTKCTAKPVGKILHKLAIVSEAATTFQVAFYSLFNSKSPNFSEVKTHVNVPICLHLKNTLYSSLSSLRISFWA